MTPRYAASQVTQQGVPIVQLSDAQADLRVSIAPSHGNIAFELLHHGQNFFYSPYSNPGQMAGQTALFGVPLLAPWANRLSSDTYTINGASYTLNRHLGNLRFDSHTLPIHGLVLFASWTVTKVNANDTGAEAVSTLSFTRHPRWMAQFPFAHHLELSYRIAEGRLIVRLSITNECEEAMPVTIGFHPYFRLPESHRDDWLIHLPVQSHLPLSDLYIPLGPKQPFPSNGFVGLKGLSFDDVFTDLLRDTSGYGVFEVQDGKRSIRVGFGPKFPVAVVYAPPGKDFICFEPMAAPTDALHLAASGKYADLQYVNPSETWSEEFWVHPQL